MRKRLVPAATLAALCLVGQMTALFPAHAATHVVTSDRTNPDLQIANRKNLRIVVQINSPGTLPNGISKQLLAVKNLNDQYAALGMKSGTGYEIVLVFRAEGAQFLLNDVAYDLKVKAPHPPGNPNRAILGQLSQDGFKMYECGFAMQMKGYTKSDLLPYSQVVVTGIGAIVDLEKSGYLEITP